MLASPFRGGGGGRQRRRNGLRCATTPTSRDPPTPRPPGCPAAFRSFFRRRGRSARATSRVGQRRRRGVRGGGPLGSPPRPRLAEDRSMIRMSTLTPRRHSKILMASVTPPDPPPSIGPVRRRTGGTSTCTCLCLCVDMFTYINVARDAARCPFWPAGPAAPAAPRCPTPTQHPTPSPTRRPATRLSHLAFRPAFFHFFRVTRIKKDTPRTHGPGLPHSGAFRAGGARYRRSRAPCRASPGTDRASAGTARDGRCRRACRGRRRTRRPF